MSASVTDVATADIKVEGLLDYWNYFQKFREFSKRFTDEDGITYKDVVDCLMAVAEILSFGPEGKELLDVIVSIRRKDSITVTFDEGIEFLTVLSKRLKTLLPPHVNGDEATPAPTPVPAPFQEIPFTTGAAPLSLAVCCSRMADEISTQLPATSATADGPVTMTAAPVPNAGFPPIILWIAGQIGGQVISIFFRRFFEKKVDPSTT